MTTPTEHLTGRNGEPAAAASRREGRGAMRAPAPRWPLERVLFALAGTVGVTSGLLAILVSRWFALLTLLAGANQWLYALTGSCPASLILRRTCRLTPATPDDGQRAAAHPTQVTV